MIRLSNSEQHPYGRVDETGTVYLREADGERVIGQYPDGTAEEAIAYYVRKYNELAGQVTLLEQRAKGGAQAGDLGKALGALQSSLADANALGDLAALRTRLETLNATLGELTEQQSAANEAELAEAIAFRSAIVDRVEALAAEDPAKAQWKTVSSRLEALFAEWQAHQHDGPRIPRGDANALWKRFRDARTQIENHRKSFFAELDASHRDARNRKQALVAEAEALAPQGADGVVAYRALLDQWKLAGRAGKRQDDALWDRFKAAGDTLYQARNEVVARDDEEFGANLLAKLALLDEAEPLIEQKDRSAARDALTSIQRRWDEIGKVPRDKVRSVEDRLRKVEAAVRKREDDHWRASNPEKKARSEGLAAQLEDAIAKLEQDLAAAKKTGNAAKVAKIEESIATQQSWLKALG